MLNYRLKTNGIVILLMLCCQLALGQDLTKEETINYINKKLKEAISYDKTNLQGRTYKITAASISLRGDEVVVHNSRSSKNYERSSECPDYTVDDYFTFSPVRIRTIKNSRGYDEKESIGVIELTLLPNTVKVVQAIQAYTKVVPTYTPFVQGPTGHRCTEWKEIDRSSKVETAVFLYFLKEDPSNFDKIRKAFEYLIDLMKAEDDPFGE